MKESVLTIQFGKLVGGWGKKGGEKRGRGRGEKSESGGERERKNKWTHSPAIGCMTKLFSRTVARFLRETRRAREAGRDGEREGERGCTLEWTLSSGWTRLGAARAASVMRVNCRLSLQTSSALAHFILLSFSRSPLSLLKVPRCSVPLVSLLLLQPSLVITSPIFFIHFHPLIFGFSFFFSFCLLNSTLFLSLSPQHHLLTFTHLFNFCIHSNYAHLWSSK